MSYRHLSFEQRCKIAAFWKAGYLQKTIAQEIGVSPATVSREIRRNIRWNGVYSPEQADVFYSSRRKYSRKVKKFTSEVQEITREKILLKWSPEQISGYAKRHHLFSISHEWIYQYVLADKKMGGDLYLNLRFGKKKAP
jgi:IS30 family transposase